MKIQMILIKVCAHISEYKVSIFIPCGLWSSVPHLNACVAISEHEKY